MTGQNTVATLINTASPRKHSQGRCQTWVCARAGGGGSFRLLSSVWLRLCHLVRTCTYTHLYRNVSPTCQLAGGTVLKSTFTIFPCHMGQGHSSRSGGLLQMQMKTKKGTEKTFPLPAPSAATVLEKKLFEQCGGALFQSKQIL